MKKVTEFLSWMVSKNKVGILYYLFILGGFYVTFKQRESIVDNNNVPVFIGIVMFLVICFVLFTFQSVLPEFRKRND